jgi:hypothetical protein
MVTEFTPNDNLRLDPNGRTQECAHPCAPSGFETAAVLSGDG